MGIGVEVPRDEGETVAGSQGEEKEPPWWGSEEKCSRSQRGSQDDGMDCFYQMQTLSTRFLQRMGELYLDVCSVVDWGEQRIPNQLLTVSIKFHSSWASVYP